MKEALRGAVVSWERSSEGGSGFVGKRLSGGRWFCGKEALRGAVVLCERGSEGGSGFVGKRL